VNGRLDGPIRAAAGLDGGEIAPLQGLAIFRQSQFPQRKEIVGYVRAFQTTVGAVEDFMAVLGYLGDSASDVCAEDIKAGGPSAIRRACRL